MYIHSWKQEKRRQKNIQVIMLAHWKDYICAFLFLHSGQNEKAKKFLGCLPKIGKRMRFEKRESKKRQRNGEKDQGKVETMMVK